MTDNSLQYLIGITMIPGIGSITARKLIAYSGSAQAVFTEKKSLLLRIPDIGEKVANAIAKNNVLAQAEAEIQFALKNKIKITTFLDHDYPARLKECSDAPIVLYQRGAAEVNESKMLGIVGTRNATPYGRDIVEKILKDLAEKGHRITVVSGLAYGIDIAAHRAALKFNHPTIGVLAHGLDTLYPAAHRQVAHDMMEHGAILTEFPTHTIPDKPLFVRRNRIIAGMTDATLVVESGESGGALITAEYANNYNRDVMAVPGKLTDHYSRGCNNLIKRNKAHLVESADDIEYVLNWAIDPKQKVQQQQLFLALTAEEQTIVDLLRQQNESYIDEICFNTSLPVSKVSSLLLTLELNGVVKSLPGKKYQLL